MRYSEVEKEGVVAGEVVGVVAERDPKAKLPQSTITQALPSC